MKALANSRGSDSALQMFSKWQGESRGSDSGDVGIGIGFLELGGWNGWDSREGRESERVMGF